MSDLMNRISSDLPTIQQIAARPSTANPMLRALLEQAQSLTEIHQWAANVQQAVADESATEPEAPAVAAEADPIDIKSGAKRQA